MPRRRPDPLGQVADGGRVHLVPALEILEQDRAELDQAEGRFAPGDDGVDAGAVAIVRADAAVAVTVESRGIAAGAAVPLAGDQIDERRFLGLLHVSLSLLGRDWGRRVVGRRDPDRSPWARGFCDYTVEYPQSQEGDGVTRAILRQFSCALPDRRHGPVPARK